MTPRKAIAGLLALGTIAAGLLVSGPAFGSSTSPRAALQKRTPAFATTRAGAARPDLVDHGGPVLAASHLYAIWWGDTTLLQPDTQRGMTSFLQGFGSSAYLQTAKQYMRGAAPSASYRGSFTNAASGRRASYSVRSVAKAVVNALAANNAQPDPAGIYVVIGSTFPARANYCAWHSAMKLNGTTIAFAFVPNLDNVQGCDVAGANKYSAATQAMANVTAHELIETITDPALNAWYDPQGEEIADKCAWQFAGTVTVGATKWHLQSEWSNAVHGCVES